MKTRKLSSLKKKEYFRFPGKKKVYVFDGGGPKKGFNYYAFDDVNAFYSTKTDRVVETDFDF